MKYQHARQHANLSDFSSGRVFHSLPGYPAFPVRLASEIFQRCLAIRRSQGRTGPCIVYDPCCGAAYHLSTLAYAHWSAISRIIASDIDGTAVSLAERNLNLLTLNGMDERIAEIKDMLNRYAKDSHRLALYSAEVLRSRLSDLIPTHLIATEVFSADATNLAALKDHIGNLPIDIVLTDVPYGNQSQWHREETASPLLEPLESLESMLMTLSRILTVTALVAVASAKKQKILHEGYRRVNRLQIGKRQVLILQLRG